MKPKIAIALIAAAMILPTVTSLFDLDARRRATTVVVTEVVNTQVTISPN